MKTEVDKRKRTYIIEQEGKRKKVSGMELQFLQACGNKVKILDFEKF